MKALFLALLFTPLLLLGPIYISLFLPYVENWPYTWIVYGTLSLIIGVIIATAVKHGLNAKSFGDPVMKIITTLIMGFFSFCVFWCFTLRRETEPLESLSFERAVVLNKDRSSNHNYPRLKLETEKGKVLTLDIPGQEDVWQKLKTGNQVKKSFRKEEILPLSPEQES
mgnify:CR=1 FL=1